MRFALVLVSALAAISLGVADARAQISDGVVKIGVLNDQSGLYADLGGPGSVVAARMAVEDLLRLGAEASGDDHLAILGQSFADGLQRLIHRGIDEAAGIDDHEVGRRVRGRDFIPFGA